MESGVFIKSSTIKWYILNQFVLILVNLITCQEVEGFVSVNKCDGEQA